MSISAIMEQPAVPGDKRKDVRWRIRLELPGSLDQGTNVVIHDLSTAGMLIETEARLDIGQVVTVSLPEADNRAARVVWRDGALFGCRFEEPLPQAAVSATKLRSAVAAPPVEKEEALADRLLRLRRASGLSRAALSERTGFSKPSIWAWETGKTVPRRSNLLVLADIFGLTEQQLSRGEGTVMATAAPRQEPEQRSNTLHDAIDQARSRIAAIAGVEPSMVHISIDF
ncbi:helix-turn-helix domain-containing protein [Sphingobium sp. DC-2]|uniref:helix-turn-helix domain-containing protein n=1 Tax=Sphingobium sp. DC-2 TaxID=1303256 RepID=UPI0004C315D0|nr:helix-turn-helix domain-containing protein [Sphingobium sp. DC-2]